MPRLRQMTSLRRNAPNPYNKDIRRQIDPKPRKPTRKGHNLSCRIPDIAHSGHEPHNARKTDTRETGLSYSCTCMGSTDRSVSVGRQVCLTTVSQLGPGKTAAMR